MSMAHALEVRSPLLDDEVVECLAALPLSFKLRNGTSKYLLRKVSERILPPSALLRPKRGFAIPQGSWLRNGLRHFAEELLLERTTLARGLFREQTVRRMLRHHASGRRDYGTWIWCLIVLELWFRKSLASR